MGLEKSEVGMRKLECGRGKGEADDRSRKWECGMEEHSAEGIAHSVKEKKVSGFTCQPSCWPEKRPVWSK